MKASILVTICVAGALGGCAKLAWDSAPADQHHMLVVGQDGNSPTIWKCPKHPGQGGCQRMNVVVQ